MYATLMLLLLLFVHILLLLLLPFLAFSMGREGICWLVSPYDIIAEVAVLSFCSRVSCRCALLSCLFLCVLFLDCVTSNPNCLESERKCFPEVLYNVACLN